MSRKIFILTERLYKLLKLRNRLQTCCICGRKFSVGDTVKSVIKGGKGRRKWICSECSKKYNIW